ncbi:FKBP-type peptidyl-prolyl cis-trans isomerase N-terminal domain-containing protein [Pantoea sp. y20]
MFKAASKGKGFYLLALLITTSTYADNYRWDRSIGRGNFSNEKFLPASPADKIPNIPSPPSKRAISVDAQQQNKQIKKLKKSLALEKAQVQKLKEKLKKESDRDKSCSAMLDISSNFPPLTGGQTLLAKTIPILKPALTFLPLLTGNLSFADKNRPSTGNSDPILLTDKNKNSYASGVVIGKNISLMESQRKMLNIPFDKKNLLDGINDYLKQRSLLSETEVDAFIARQDDELAQASHDFAQRQQKEDERYIKKFVQRTGVKRAATGFYYRIEKKGEGRVMPNDQVDIQVRESLTDGTVVNDMARNGSFISSRLSDYPPLFKDAISFAGKKGVITLVVPPELAWGDSGYPPSIPPGATLIYLVSILEPSTYSARGQ